MPEAPRSDNHSSVERNPARPAQRDWVRDNTSSWQELRRFFILIAVIGLSFSSCLFHPFVNWDDDGHIFENTLVTSAQLSDIPAIFQTTVNKTYIPFTIVSFNIEHRLFGLNPFFFHLDNVLLHILVCIAIYFFIQRIGFEKSTALTTALLFGVHPMHVESVAWVTQRKDVLYSLFYILAMDRYWAYLTDGKKRSYLASLLFAFFSILAKPMALSLPLIICLLNWYKNGKLSKDSLVRIIPFFCVVIPIAWLTYHLNARVPHFDLGQSILLWSWTATFYIKKFLTPFLLFPLYQVPQPVSLLNPSYLSGVLLVIALPTAMFIWRKNRLFMFACLFYILSTFFLWRYDTTMDITMVGDRFMYLPSLGFCLFLIAELSKHPQIKWAIPVMIIFCVLKTSTQCAVWQDDLTLWNYVIDHKQEVFLAYNSRAVALVKRHAKDLAFADLHKALALKSDYPRGYYNLGKLFADSGDSDRALASFNKAISLNTKDYKYFLERGITLSKRKEYDQAILDFNTAVSLKPDDAGSYNNRGLTHKLMGDHTAALNDFTKALELDPRMMYAYFNRGNLWQELKNYKEALNDFNRAKALGFPVDPARLQELEGLASR